jgi:membrane protein
VGISESSDGSNATDAAVDDQPPTQQSHRHIRAAGTHITHLRTRVESTTAGEVQRRLKDLNMMNQALILSALAMVLVIPALVSLAAILPVGSEHSIATSWGRHLGLTAQASADVRRLFNKTGTIRSSTTNFSLLFTIISAYAWPAELQRSYKLIWDVRSRGIRDLWRPILWIPSLFLAIGVVALSGAIAPGTSGAILTGVIALPVWVAWAWWTQHFLLSGRVSWRALLPGAIATGAALVGMSVVTSFYLSRAITSNARQYGPIGVVFVLMSWLTSFSLVMLGGALVGHTIRRRRAGPPSSPQAELIGIVPDERE